MSNNRKSQESPAKTLRDLSSIYENRFCFDCGQRCPTYVNISIGSFVCTGCGGALRKYNQRVKSISMSNFNSQEISFMKRRGNKACGKIYLALCNGKEPDERENNFDDYLRLKYQVQKWYRNPDPKFEEEALKENEEALSRLSQNLTQKSNHISVNAAAGLIINNNRSLQNPPPKSASQSQSTFESPSTINSGSSAASTSSLSPPQPSLTPLFSTATIKEEKPVVVDPATTVFDPFADFVAARPLNVASSSQNQQSSFFSAQPSVTGPPIDTSGFFLSTQPAHSFSAQTFPSSASSNDFFSTVNQSLPQPTMAPSSPYLTSAFNPAPPVPADKYAALAELDRMGKAAAETKQHPTLSSSMTMAFGGSMRTVQQKNPFSEISTYNPFQTSSNAGNPFANIQKNSTAAVASTAVPLGQNSFNPFINAR